MNRYPTTKQQNRTFKQRKILEIRVFTTVIVVVVSLTLTGHNSPVGKPLDKGFDTTNYGRGKGVGRSFLTGEKRDFEDCEEKIFLLRCNQLHNKVYVLQLFRQVRIT